VSDAMYPTRLRWGGRKGYASHEEVAAVLYHPPVIKELVPYDELDYAPRVVAQIRPKNEAMRDMTNDERRQVHALLIRFATEARDALDGGSTLAVVMA
jgi:hypothetical protein